MTLTGWSGPLPPPAALQAFEDIVPGSAVQIIDEFRAEAAHRRHLEVRQTSLVVRETHIGQFLAIFFVILMIMIIAFAIWMKAEWVAGLLGTGVIAAGVVAFIKGRS
jgi:uncharacterized membrane protein